MYNFLLIRFKYQYTLYIYEVTDVTRILQFESIMINQPKTKPSPNPCQSFSSEELILITDNTDNN